MQMHHEQTREITANLHDGIALQIEIQICTAHCPNAALGNRAAETTAETGKH